MCEDNMNVLGWMIDDKGNRIHNTAVIEKNVEIGYNNIISPYAVLGMPGFVRSREFGHDKNKIIIGNNNWIGNHASIMIGNEGDTVIGDSNMIMNYVNIGHDVVIGNENEIGARSTIAGFCKIGNKNKIKLSVTFRNRCEILDENIIGMNSCVTKSFMVSKKIIYGLPASIVREIP